MIQVYKLTKRHMDENDKMPKDLRDIKVFSTCVGHGVGTIDFSEKVAEFSDDEYAAMFENAGEYAKFKLGNLSRYFEIEIFTEHARRLIPELTGTKLGEILENLREGYIVIRKDF